MPQRRILLVLFSFFLLVAARQRSVRHPSPEWPLTAPPADKYSVAQPSEVTTEHLELDLTVDFDEQRLHGSATLHIKNLTGTRTLLLDANSLNITSITLDGETPAQWTLAGQPPMQTLNVAIEPHTETVTVVYSTTPVDGGLFWLTPDQTFGDAKPFLYSLNEPIGARSWIPIQDTPSVRMTYDATIHAPRGMLALMSSETNERRPNDTGVYRFRMSYRIPAYLIAIAVGRLEYRELDGRIGVYAEPELVDDAAWEVQYLPAMMHAAERIAGTFPFSRHDLLFLPPDFVAGGMEHPMLNFIHASMITGMRPELPQPHTLIAHELAHSWAGDSATLATWNDVWLNEGVTSYLTIRFIEALSGPEMGEYLFWNDRRNYTAYAANAKPEDTVLHRDVPYPGYGFSATGYVKGELFIKTLEDTLGRDRFDRFLWRYFRAFAYRWIDHVNFLAYLRATAIGGDVALDQRLRLEEWVYEPGVPSNITAPVTSAINERARQRANAFSAGTPIAQLAPESWSPTEVAIFLTVAVIQSRMAEVDEALALSSRPAPPLPWLIASIRADYAPGMVAVERALARHTPTSRIVTLYRTLDETAAGRARALQWFERNRHLYDRKTEELIASILDVAQARTVAREAA